MKTTNTHHIHRVCKLSISVSANITFPGFHSRLNLIRVAYVTDSFAKHENTLHVTGKLLTFFQQSHTSI